MAEGSWTLLDAEAHRAEHPRSFFIPDGATRASLETGDLVKLVFLPADGDGGERMWVEVTDRAPGATWAASTTIRSSEPTSSQAPASSSSRDT